MRAFTAGLVCELPGSVVEPIQAAEAALGVHVRSL